MNPITEERHGKIQKSPFTALFPLPAVLVTAAVAGEKPNIITIAWTGVINSQPPMVYVSVRPAAYSHRLLREAGEYVINIPGADRVRETDYCGMVSGRDVDKFAETGFTAVPAARVRAPLIKECPANIECLVRQVLSLGSHDVFIAEVAAVHLDASVLDEKGRADFEKMGPFAYCLGEYRGIGGVLGTHGFSRRSGA